VDSVRTALDLDPGVPVVMCDARDRDSGKQTLIELVQYVMNRPRQPAMAH